MEAVPHLTVMKEEVVALLAPSGAGCVLDGTLGWGGHAEALLSEGARVVGLDQDPAALLAARQRLAPFGDRFTAVKSNFRDARRVLDELGIAAVEGALVDLGVSSPQLDEAERGFSFRRAGPLDMRMDTEGGRTLEAWLAEVDEKALAKVIFEWGEEPFSRPVARAIKAAQAQGALGDTAALAEVVAAAIPRARWPRSIHPATRTFQALRIAVNDELGALEAWLDALPELIAPGGRAAIISFHSLEDRRVKRRFRELSQGCVCPPDMPVCGCARRAGWRLVTKQAVEASEEERTKNPRSRSARLRCVERLEE